jgi:endonuclease/exonuclease/phosphatase (EEP) superfamily protein YafD
MKIFLFLTLVFSTQAFAKRYIVPQDKDVLININHLDSSNEIYPLNIKVLIWNIYKGENKSWEKDYKDYSYKKDLLLLQEAHLNQNMLGVFSETKDLSYIFATSWIDTKDKNTASGIATASNSTSIEANWQRSYYREPYLKTPKMTLFTKYKLAGTNEELLVGNIHAINFVKAYKLRHMLEKAAEVISKHKGPVLFAGDFNTWTQTKLNNMNAIFKKLGMKSIQFKNDVRKRFRGNILDHAWVRGLNVQSSRVTKTLGSDHAPIFLELGIY